MNENMWQCKSCNQWWSSGATMCEYCQPATIPVKPPKQAQTAPKQRLQVVSGANTRTNKKHPSTSKTVDGITFHSKTEARRYVVLRDAQRAGIIHDLVLQPKFDLLDTARIPDDALFPKATFKKRSYKADFLYTYQGMTIIEDTKGETKKRGEWRPRVMPYDTLRHRLLIAQLKPAQRFVLSTQHQNETRNQWRMWYGVNADEWLWCIVSTNRKENVA